MLWQIYVTAKSHPKSRPRRKKRFDAAQYFIYLGDFVTIDTIFEDVAAFRRVWSLLVGLVERRGAVCNRYADAEKSQTESKQLVCVKS